MEVLQVKTIQGIKFIEVLDHSNFDRSFRVVWRDVDIRVGDQIWWCGYQGLLSRAGEFEDKSIGRCEPSSAFTIDPEFAKQYESRFAPDSPQFHLGDNNA